MTTATEQTTWVGRPLLRVEDDALLRGEGRFLDDLEPAAHAGHAAIVRSQLPHARIAVDASAALEAPGVIGVLTGEDVVALSRPFPAGIDSPVKQYALAIDEVRYVGEPVAVVVAADRYLAEDAAELVAVDYDPLEPTLDPVAAAETTACVHDRSFHYGDVDEAMRRADLVVRRDVHGTALHVHPGRVLRGRRRLGRDGGPADGVGELPGPLHAARRRRGRARPARRPAAPADAARLGRLLRRQVLGLRVRRARSASRRASSASPCAGSRTGSSTWRPARPRPGA